MKTYYQVIDNNILIDECLITAKKYRWKFIIMFKNDTEVKFYIYFN